MKDYMNKKGG